jgi:hypothetical protein
VVDRVDVNSQHAHNYAVHYVEVQPEKSIQRTKHNMSETDSSVVVVPEGKNGVFSVTATATKTTAPGEHDKADLYRYQLGFGNYHSTEAVYVVEPLQS